MNFHSEQSGYTIRLCRTIAEYAAVVELQRVVWHFADVDLTPVRSLVIAAHSGGMTFGAFATEDGQATESLLGFAHALPAFDDANQPYLYSQMLAVLPDQQDAGIGHQLKLAQREHAQARKLDLIKWTFDPLQSRNAYLNIVKLGGVIRKYVANYYGNSSTSALHRGLDTDRLFAEWWVDSARVADALAGKREQPEPVAAVEIPYDIELLKQQDMAMAQAEQQRVRNEFNQLLNTGLYCAGFLPGRASGKSQYLFYVDPETASNA